MSILQYTVYSAIPPQHVSIALEYSTSRYCNTGIIASSYCNIIIILHPLLIGIPMFMFPADCGDGPYQVHDERTHVCTTIQTHILINKVGGGLLISQPVD